jgi:hypothetical protein
MDGDVWWVNLIAKKVSIPPPKSCEDIWWWREDINGALGTVNNCNPRMCPGVNVKVVQAHRIVKRRLHSTVGRLRFQTVWSGALLYNNWFHLYFSFQTVI